MPASGSGAWPAIVLEAVGAATWRFSGIGSRAQTAPAAIMTKAMTMAAAIAYSAPETSRNRSLNAFIPSAPDRSLTIARNRLKVRYQPSLKGFLNGLSSNCAVTVTAQLVPAWSSRPHRKERAKRASRRTGRGIRAEARLWRGVRGDRPSRLPDQAPPPFLSFALDRRRRFGSPCRL